MIGFSIIIPVYNSYSYLEDCVHSIVNQGFPEYEIILVDDGSKDKSPVLCDSLAAKYPHIIRVFHQPNSGQFLARMKGILNAKFDFIIPVDSDDILRSDSLQLLNTALINTQADIVFFMASKKDDYSKPIYKYPFGNMQVFEGSDKVLLYKMFLGTNVLNSVPMKAYKRDLLISKEYSTNNAINVRNGEDLLQILPVFTKASRITYLDEVLYYYRPNEMSVTNSYSKSFFESRKIIYKELETYIDIWNLNKHDAVSILDKKTLRNMYAVIKNCYYANETDRVEKLNEIHADSWFQELFSENKKQHIRFVEKLVLWLVYKGYFRVLNGLMKL